ncbi:Uncharacterised protein [Mycobacteroides abscessus subsp. abscessus]|nr:Uncharacterised protein [Mycobacteroides abscessus subsp. abscessus]
METGIFSSFALRAAVKAPRGSSGSSGTVSLPSESSTMRAGGAPSSPPSTALRVWICCRAAKIPSPVAVLSASCNLSTACLVAS